MEPNNIPIAAKRFWNLVRGIWLVLRKGISKPKLLMLDLNIMVKRGKLAGKNIMHNIMSHHHHHHHHHHASHDIPVGVGPDEYEFSCSNTPVNHRAGGIFGFHKRNKQQNIFFGSCTHAPQTSEEEEEEDEIAGQLSEVMMSEALARSPSVSAFLESPAVSELMYGSPALPGFGRTPVVRQLRVTDSPFPVIGDIEENCQVDAAAEEFIGKFYQQLKKQIGKERKY